jgi:hypothetical protein
VRDEPRPATLASRVRETRHLANLSRVEFLDTLRTPLHPRGTSAEVNCHLNLLFFRTSANPAACDLKPRQASLSRGGDADCGVAVSAVSALARRPVSAISGAAECACAGRLTDVRFPWRCCSALGIRSVPLPAAGLTTPECVGRIRSAGRGTTRHGRPSSRPRACATRSTLPRARIVAAHTDC